MVSIKLFGNFIEITLCHGCSPVNLVHIFRTPFPKNTSRGLFVYPAASLKEKTPTQVFSDEFCEILKTPFSQNLSRKLFMFYGKIFYQYNSKEPSEKRKKWKQLVRKTIYIKFHILFKKFFNLLSAFNDILKTRVFRNNAILLRICLFYTTVIKSG